MFITTESHHVGERFIFDPLPFPWSCSGLHTSLIPESPLLQSRNRTHENHELRSWSHVHEKRAPESKLYHFYDSSAALRLEASKLEKSLSRVIATNKSVRVKGDWGCFGISVLKGEISIVLTDVSTVNCQVCNANANGIWFLYFFTQDSIIFHVWFKLPKLPHSNHGITLIKKTDILYSGKTHVMDLANFLKKFRIRFSLSRPKAHQICLKVSKLKNTNVQLSIDSQKYVSQRSKFCFIYIQTWHNHTKRRVTEFI